MAIDSSLFMADIPAGTYNKGDIITLNIKSGPGVVRSGRGTALLKRVTVGIIGGASGSLTYWKVKVKNSDWIDEMISASTPLINATALDERTGAIQRGNDCPLTPNSSWVVEAEALNTLTTTVANTLFALIDIDYPSVSSIVDPDALPGIPTTIEYEHPSAITLHALGTSSAATWETVNVDFFKAGYEYALQKLEMSGLSTLACGFIALANAAGMAGLQRIIPVAATAESIRNKVEYATKLVKGPMDIKYMVFVNSGTGTTDNVTLLLDFVKRRI